ncbi:NAD-dependent epimerase/dehydratase family protein [Flavobacteriaceae bacterium F08102]|nr:NAD-dependent epimerase/dehydratase family protein [Flavobacteriaceae bacterium F08102]
MTNTILIIGAGGQIGTELTQKLRGIYGSNNVIASDIRDNKDLSASGIFELVDATDKGAVENIIKKYKVTEVYLMAALLSAMAEKYPAKAWDLNMNSLFHILNFAKEGLIKKVFWPSSIAVFGPTTPKEMTPQETVMEPNTVYGISKLSGERWCDYYHQKYGVDVRSVRYPGLISWKTLPGGGTTDYAVEIFHSALQDGQYTCFLKEDTRLPMMYMDDAITATVDLMLADKPKQYKAYNINAIDFTPKEISEVIQKHIPDFTIEYAPDFRQKIADGWPASIDDSVAQREWGWDATFDLERTVETMLKNLA